MNKLLMTTAAALLSTAAHANMQFTVPLDVEAGHMNIRSGPGTNHSLVGMVPAGQTVDSTHCRKRDDHIQGSDFCFISWNGLHGWVASSGLMPVNTGPNFPVPPVLAPPVRTPAPETLGNGGAGNVDDDDNNDLNCGATYVDFGGGPDSNPVIKVGVSYDPPHHAWEIYHTLANGQVVSRGQQYALTDWTRGGVVQWTGKLNRDPSMGMIGEIKQDRRGRLFYEEWLYKNNKVAMHSSARCTVNDDKGPPPWIETFRE